MKFFGFFHLFFALGFGLAMMPAASSADTGPKIRVVYNAEPNNPFILGRGTVIDAERPGITIDLLREVSRQIGIEFEFTRVPWQRALFMVEKNRADAVFHSSFKEERAAFGAYPMKDGLPDETRKIADFSYHIYTLTDSDISWDGKQIGKTQRFLGALRGSAIVDQLKNAGHRVDEGIDAGVNLRKLTGRRISAYVDLEGVVDPYLSARPELLAMVRKFSPPIRTRPYFLMFSKTFAEEQPVLTKQIWNAIGEFRRSPTFETLKKKYGLL
ncbi:MAG: transporter substrate-binding domain-containing protein [Rhodospirillales bacterium]|nr:transporter substrate-binding domain-containing protein [Rhodospirillales bacterium]